MSQRPLLLFLNPFRSRTFLFESHRSRIEHKKVLEF
jgi:hypothetical protein